jgi:DNA-binding winged helix-turn-helix (wHTH) protein
MQSVHCGVLYRFGAFTFDSRMRQLARGDAPLSLTPKAARLLELLLDAAPRLVTRDELYPELWPGTFVEPGNVHNLVSEIRKALGDDSHAILQTVHRSGYAVAVDVTRDLGARWRLVIGDTSIPLPDGETIVGRDTTGTPDVSRRHARITIDAQRATIEDLGSKNGTFVGTTRIASPTELRDGDEVVLGRTRATFRAADATTMTVT